MNFDGGDLSNDSGLLLYKELDEKLGLSNLIDAVHLDDPEDHDIHQNGDVLKQKVYQHVAGYHADDDADSLRYDPALTHKSEK